MAIVHIRQDTIKTSNGQLLPVDVLTNINLIIAFGYVAEAEEYRNSYVQGLQPQRITIEGISHTNPFDVWGKLWEVGVKSAEAVANRVLYFRLEYRRRELENELKAQEVAQARIETAARAYEFVKKLETDGLPTDQAALVIADLLQRQGATLKIERPK